MLRAVRNLSSTKMHPIRQSPVTLRFAATYVALGLSRNEGHTISSRLFNHLLVRMFREVLLALDQASALRMGGKEQA